MLDDAPCLLVQNSVVDLLPSLATVLAPVHAASSRHRVNALTIVSVNHHRRSHRSFAAQPQWTRRVLVSFFFGQVQPVFSANIEKSIRAWRHGRLLSAFRKLVETLRLLNYRFCRRLTSLMLNQKPIA